MTGTLRGRPVLQPGRSQPLHRRLPTAILLSAAMGWAETMAFWDAVEGGLVHAMQAAVLAGASVDHYNAGLATALHKAAEKGDSAMVSALIDSGASVNLKTRIGNDTALLLAAAHGRVEAAQVLLAGGADMSIKNSKGQTAFTVASANRHAQVVKLLAQGTEPQMLAHKRIADSIRSTSVTSPPDVHSVLGSPSAVAQAASLLTLAPAQLPSMAVGGTTSVQLAVCIVDPTDRRHSTIMREIAGFDLQVDKSVTAEQLVQQTLAVLRTESNVGLHKPVLLCDGVEIPDLGVFVNRLTLAPAVARRHSQRVSQSDPALNLRLIGLKDEGWASSSARSVRGHTGSRQGGDERQRSPAGRSPAISRDGLRQGPQHFALRILPSTSGQGGTQVEPLKPNAGLQLHESVPPRPGESGITGGASVTLTTSAVMRRVEELEAENAR